MKPVEIEFLVKNNTRSGLAGVSNGVDGVEKGAGAATRSVKSLEDEIARLRKAMADTPEMDMSASLKQIETLEKQLVALQKTSQSVDLAPKDAPAAMRTYNGLNVSIQQIARELPTLAMGPQMFFLAISNNLPIFTDELARARKEYEAITAAGGKGIPVWRQLLSSILSWQTALAVGIMLSVSYGKEIGQWVSSLFNGKKALDTTAMAARNLRDAMVDGSVAAQKEVTKLQLLYGAATDVTKPYKERLQAVKNLQDIYPAYFNNLSAEQVMIGDASAAYDNLRDSIIMVAEARAAESKITEMAEAELLVKKARGYDEYTASLDAYRVAAKRIVDLRQLRDSGNAPEGIGGMVRDAEMDFVKQADAIEAARERIYDDLRRSSAGKDVAQTLETEFNGNIEKFIEYADQFKRELASTAESAYTTRTPDQLNEEYKTASKVDPTQNIKQYSEARLKRQQQLNEQSVELMEEGFDKERAQIRLEYERKRAEYEAEETKTLELIKKLRKSGADVSPDAERSVHADTDSLIGNASALRDKQLAEVDKKEQAEYDKLLEKYETYQQGRARIAEKYDKEIAAMAANPENQRLAEQAKQKALDDFTQSFAGQFPAFEAWADGIVSLSVDKLEEELKRVQDQLTMIENLNPYDQNAIAQAKAKVSVVEGRLAKERSKAEKKAEKEATDTTNWTELHHVLEDVIDTFDEVGEVIGEAGGQIVSTAGKVASSALQMVNAVQAYQKAADAGSKLGMASGILGGISAGISAITTIFSLFKGGESSLEKNLRLAREFNEELVLMHRQAQINSSDFDNIFGDRVYDRFRQNATAAREALEALNRTKEEITGRGAEVYNPFSKGSTGLAGLDVMAKTWESESASIANMQVQTRHSTWFRNAKYASLGDLLPGLFDDGQIDMSALKKFVEEGGDTFQHLSDENKRMLEQMVEDWEMYEDAMDAVRDYLSGIFGDLGNSMTDALVSAAENGTSAFDAMAESVGKVLRQLAKDMLYSVTLGPIVEQAQKQMKDISKSDMSTEEKFAAYSSTLKNMISSASDQQGTVMDLWKQLSEWAEQNGMSIANLEGSTQQAQAGAIQGVTQESFGHVEGIVTSVQMHVASMDNRDEGMMPILGSSLEALDEIAANSKNLPLIYALLTELQRDGIKVK